MKDIKIFKQSSIKIDNIYFDPYCIDNYYNDAKYIFITHSHYDHFSYEDIVKVCNDDTIYIAPRDVAVELKDSGILSGKIIEVIPNEKYFINNIRFTTTYAYNKNKMFHPKGNDWVGYLISINNVTYYVCGDTDLLDENCDIECDILFIPIGGKYTMDYKEAARYTNIIKPKVVIPIHYGFIVGSKDLSTKFAKLIDNEIKVKIISCY